MTQQTSLREQIIQELEQTPDSRLPEILAFCRSLKQPPQSSTTDFMEFAGMAADEGELIQGIVDDAEANRQLDLTTRQEQL